jgi:hypothetical protein
MACPPAGVSSALPNQRLAPDCRVKANVRRMQPEGGSNVETVEACFCDYFDVGVC